MQLTVPQRTVADTGSFPVDPLGVAQWLNELQGVKSASDAREVYRGLKHSNRLHNDVDRRRAVLSCFIPVLREIHQHLSELTHAQPLPLTREFHRSAKLRDSLLREEVFAFKLLLTDSKDPKPDDARRAMRALARQAESVIHSYRELPRGILQDAHQLYLLAEEHGFVDSKPFTDNDKAPITTYDLNGKLTPEVPDSLADHYRYILLLFLADLRQQRVRQLPLLLEYLRECASEVDLRTIEKTIAEPLLYSVDLEHASLPEPAYGLLPGDHEQRRFFGLTPVVTHIEKRIKALQTNQATLLDSDTLERQSLLRLALAFKRSRQRRAARAICHEESVTSFGHKEIANALILAESTTDREDVDNDSADSATDEAIGLRSSWIIMNKSPQGCMITNSNCKAGLVQVGDIVSIANPGSDPSELNTKTNIGIVRWMHAREDNALDAGIEYLARKVLPVHISRLDAEGDATEKAMIITCKVEQQVMQTLLLPPFLYQTGDRVIAQLGEKQRRFQLTRCLQTNGLFSHFSLRDS